MIRVGAEDVTVVVAAKVGAFGPVIPNSCRNQSLSTVVNPDVVAGGGIGASLKASGVTMVS